MAKYEFGDGQYTVNAKNEKEAEKTLRNEYARVDKIRGKMDNLFTKGGVAETNFSKNTEPERLNIEFNDEKSLIFSDPENQFTKGEVRQRAQEGKDFKYELAYRYPDINGHNADFRLAHEMGHLVLNPSETSRQIHDAETNTTQVSGLIRQDSNGHMYGLQMQENAINLLGELAIRDDISADDIMTGKVDLTEYNHYKQCDNLTKALAVSMRNDYKEEMTFEQLAENKLDSVIEHEDGTSEPANTFFYGIVNDSSIVQKEFDKYMGEGAWRDLDAAITQMHNLNLPKEKFDLLFSESQKLIATFSNERMQEKYLEAKEKYGDNIPNLDNKQKMINKMLGIPERQDVIQDSHINQENSNQPSYTINEFGEIIRPGRAEKVEKELNQSNEDIGLPEGYSINEFGEIIRPDTSNVNVEQKQTFAQKIAQKLQGNKGLMNVSFVKKFVDKQLNILPPSNDEVQSKTEDPRNKFINSLKNNVKSNNEIGRMSDPAKIERMQQKMKSARENNNNIR